MIPGLVCRGSYWKPEVQRHGGPDCQACVPRRTFPTISKQVDPPALSHHSFPTRTDFNTKVRQKVSTLFLFYYYIIYLEFQKQSTSLFYIFTFLCDAFFPSIVPTFYLPSAKHVFGWAHSHWCTSAFTSSLHENLPPLTASLSGTKRWKPDGTKSLTIG